MVVEPSPLIAKASPTALDIDEAQRFLASNFFYQSFSSKKNLLTLQNCPLPVLTAAVEAQRARILALAEAAADIEDDGRTSNARRRELNNQRYGRHIEAALKSLA
jgi:hypothetical protein